MNLRRLRPLLNHFFGYPKEDNKKSCTSEFWYPDITHTEAIMSDDPAVLREIEIRFDSDDVPFSNISTPSIDKTSSIPYLTFSSTVYDAFRILHAINPQEPVSIGLIGYDEGGILCFGSRYMTKEGEVYTTRIVTGSYGGTFGIFDPRIPISVIFLNDTPQWRPVRLFPEDLAGR